jgi:hypothetical protein
MRKRLREYRPSQKVQKIIDENNVAEQKRLLEAYELLYKVYATSVEGNLADAGYTLEGLRDYITVETFGSVSEDLREFEAISEFLKAQFGIEFAPEADGESKVKLDAESYSMLVQIINAHLLELRGAKPEEALEKYDEEQLRKNLPQELKSRSDALSSLRAQLESQLADQLEVKVEAERLEVQLRAQMQDEEAVRSLIARRAEIEAELEELYRRSRKGESFRQAHLSVLDALLNQVQQLKEYSRRSESLMEKQRELDAFQRGSAEIIELLHKYGEHDQNAGEPFELTPEERGAVMDFLKLLKIRPERLRYSSDGELLELVGQIKIAKANELASDIAKLQQDREDLNADIIQLPVVYGENFLTDIPRIVELRKLLAQQDQLIDGATAKVRESQCTVAEIRGKIAEIQSKAAEIGRQIEGSQQQIAQLEREIAEIQSEIAEEPKRRQEVEASVVEAKRANAEASEMAQRALHGLSHLLSARDEFERRVAAQKQKVEEAVNRVTDAVVEEVEALHIRGQEPTIGTFAPMISIGSLSIKSTQVVAGAAQIVEGPKIEIAPSAFLESLGNQELLEVAGAVNKKLQARLDQFWGRHVEDYLKDNILNEDTAVQKIWNEIADILQQKPELIQPKLLEAKIQALFKEMQNQVDWVREEMAGFGKNINANVFKAIIHGIVDIASAMNQTILALSREASVQEGVKENSYSRLLAQCERRQTIFDRQLEQFSPKSKSGRVGNEVHALLELQSAQAFGQATQSSVTLVSPTDLDSDGSMQPEDVVL